MDRTQEWSQSVPDGATPPGEEREPATVPQGGDGAAVDVETGPRAAVPDLSRFERREVLRRTAPSALVVHEVVREAGEGELARQPAALAFSGLAAGLSMGFSLVGQGLLTAYLPNALWRPLVASLGYSVGFLIVVLGRQQLFTENTLSVILPLLAHPNRRTWERVARLWGIVLLTNLLGAFIFATVLAHTPLFPQHIADALTTVSKASLRGDFGLTVLRAIFAGWLIALMVWLLPGAHETRLHIIIILTYLVSLGGFSHIIAGSVDTFYLVSQGILTWPDFFLRFLVPTLIGNCIGGVSLVAALNFAQVAVQGSRES